VTATEERLPSFEGLPVVRSAVRITRAGDGLSEALKLDPRALHRGEEVFFVLKGTVDQVNFRPVSQEEDGLLIRVHTVRASEIALVDPGQVEHFLASERLRIKRLQDEAASREPLPGIDDEPETNGAGEPNIFGGTFDERGPLEDDQADGDKPTRKPRKGSLAAGLELIATITDPSELFALMDEEERGKNRRAVMDAAAARIAELAAEQEAAEVRDLVAEAEAGDASDYGAH
jgi:hypothetical protein